MGKFFAIILIIGIIALAIKYIFFSGIGSLVLTSILVISIITYLISYFVKKKKSSNYPINETIFGISNRTASIRLAAILYVLFFVFVFFCSFFPLVKGDGYTFSVVFFLSLIPLTMSIILFAHVNDRNKYLQSSNINEIKDLILIRQIDNTVIEKYYDISCNCIELINVWGVGTFLNIDLLDYFLNKIKQLYPLDYFKKDNYTKTVAFQEIYNIFLSRRNDDKNEIHIDVSELKSILDNYIYVLQENETGISNIEILSILKQSVIKYYKEKATKKFNFKSDNYIEEYLNLGSINRLDESMLMLLNYAIIDKNATFSEFFSSLYNLNNKVSLEIKKKNDNLIKQKLLSKPTQKKTIVTIEMIDNMTGVQFESFMAEYFKTLGYKVRITKASGDQGIDVIIEKDLIKTGIQCKRYTAPISNTAVQEVVAGKAQYGLNNVMVVTNSFFTKGAQSLARSNEVILWDRKTLIEKIKNIELM